MTDPTFIKIMQASAIIAMGLFFGGMHWLMVGISEQFGAGVAIGVTIGVGVTFLASRQARDS